MKILDPRVSKTLSSGVYFNNGEINKQYCRHSAMLFSARVDKSGDDKVQLDLLDKEAKRLDTNNLIIDRNFKEKLQHHLEETSAHNDSGMNNELVNKEILKAKYQADYIIAYSVISGSTDVTFFNGFRF